MKVPIKFRAYSRLTCIIHEDVLVSNSGRCVGIARTADPQSISMHNTDDEFVLNQLVDYTVIGKEVYEDDIIKAYRRDDNSKSKPIYDKVKKLNGCFMVFNCTWHELSRLWQNDYEVAGNIFKNSDLLDRL